jgi:hypothetical protein
MPDNQSALIELLRPFVEAWSNRDEKVAASEAGKLTFWRSGMLSQLEAIAAGRATKETFAELRRNFEETQERVNETMVRLNKVRGKLAGSKVANQVDLILHDFNYGKSMIRSEIEVILEFGERGGRDRALRVCNAIRTLNSELQRLHRMVYGT